MTIRVYQDERGCDRVEINGEPVSKAVEDVLLEALDKVESIRYAEAAASFSE